jgi:indolepyruvate ferredoxin oxidoreductase
MSEIKMTLLPVSLDDKYVVNKGRVYISAIQALVKLPFLQHQLDLKNGLKTACFISGYRGSPLGGYDKALWAAQKYLDEHHIKFVPAINEDLGATAVWGSQQANLYPGALYDGVFGIWYGKGPGVDRSGDVFKHGNAAGTSKHGGVLVIMGDDHACRSSTLPHQSDYAMIDAMIPVLNPSSMKELFDFGIFGWALSRYSGCWVALKTIEETADSAGSLWVDIDKYSFNIPEDIILPFDGLNIRIPDTPLEQEKRLHNYKMAAVKAFARANNIDKITIKPEVPRFGIITTGKSYADLYQALDNLGISEEIAHKIGLTIYKVGLVWPLEPEQLKSFIVGLEEVLIIEEKRPIVEEQVKSILYNLDNVSRPLITGKMDEQNQVQFQTTTELTPTQIAQVLVKRLKKYYSNGVMDDYINLLNEKGAHLRPLAMQRIPYYCSGCPHNTSTKVPEGSRALAGIGCHYMVTWMNRNTSTFTQMGGEGVPWIGQAAFTETEHVFANLGDGTYYHSGILAIRQAVASKVNITFKLLYNDAVAMTGGQPLDGPLNLPQLTQQLRAEGIEYIALVSDDIEKYKSMTGFAPNIEIEHRDEFETMQQKYRGLKGTSVLIYDQTCAAEKRRRRKRKLMEDPPVRVFINENVCEGCGDCGKKSNCVSILALETEFGRKREIDQSSCNKDYSCVKGFCPSFVTIHGGQLRKKSSLLKDDFKSNVIEVPDPQIPKLEGVYDILMTGIGGTGIVTVGALLGMAAHLEGKGCTILDITGLAQKNGQVTCHLKLAPKTEDIHAVRITTGNADLVIGSDYVVTANPEMLDKMRMGKTKIIFDPRKSMSGDFTQNPDAYFPEKLLHENLTVTVGEENIFPIHAHDLASSILGDAIYSNAFLLGYAYQKGFLPLSGEAIEKAIELNGVSVASNKLAFLWGRRAAHDPKTLHALIGRDEKGEEKKKFASAAKDIIKIRMAFLEEYQNKKYAQKYEDVVKKIVDVDARFQKEDQILSTIVAKNYAKLMAYKDEYEVARLYTKGDFMKKIEDHFEGNYKLQFHLAPPLIAKKDKVTGHLKKKSYGPWMMRGFKLLAGLKFLRGGMLDPFSYMQERKMERGLISDYEETIAYLTKHLNNDNYEIACDIANIPEEIRGFGHVKEEHLQKARLKQQKLLDQFNASLNVRL